MKAVVIVAVCLVALAVAKPDQWASFKKKFGKTYKTAVEEAFRKKIFLDNVDKIYQHNALYKAGKTTYTLGINQFADLTNGEFAKRNTFIPRGASYKPKNVFKATGKVLADTVDWRQEGYVTGVKDQGQCGSCWSFSTTGSLEGQHYASTGNLVSLSEQNLMDCSYSYGNLACQGGQMDYAFQYIIANNGIDTEASYPYEERDSTNCRYSVLNKGATASDYVDVTRFSEAALQEAVASVGPISVAIDASKMSFQLYNGGVYYESSCSSIQLDHGVLVVGYGTETLEDYWLVKNSWGTTWGEQGYIKMARNRNNNCGIATEPSYPIV